MATPWVLFALDAHPDGIIPRDDVRLTKYVIESCRPVIGESLDLPLGTAAVRAESGSPLVFDSATARHQFRGAAQHLNYTSKPQRADLEARSHAPFADAAGVNCVMIPIHKSDAWWQLSPEERTGFFQKQEAHHQHVAIGAPYVERIYRKLYHSRYAGGAEAALPYDFITYFEFLDADRAAFEELLAALRDTERNPEWAYVDREFEIWMRRDRADI